MSVWRRDERRHGSGLRVPDLPELADVLRPEDVADIVLFVAHQPRY